MVASESTCDSSFSRTVDVSGCDGGCEIHVRAISHMGEGEEARFPVKKDQCSELTSAWYGV